MFTLPVQIAELLEGWSTKDCRILWQAWKDNGGNTTDDVDADEFHSFMEDRYLKNLPPYDEGQA